MVCGCGGRGRGGCFYVACEPAVAVVGGCFLEAFDYLVVVEAFVVEDDVALAVLCADGFADFFVAVPVGYLFGVDGGGFGGFASCLFAYAGLGAILVSALLTAIYMLTIVVRAFFPGKDFDYESIADVRDPNWRMMLPLCVFAVMMFVIGLHPQLLTEAVDGVVAAVFQAASGV